MRYAPTRGFLHPVLGQQEFYFENKKIEVEFDCSLNELNEEISFSATFALDVSSINDLIDDGSATCAIWVYCRPTSYRQLFRSKSSLEVSGAIPIDNSREKIQFHPLIVADREVLLDIEEAHEDFKVDGVDIIQIPKGNPLAVHKPFIVNFDYDDERSGKAIFIFKVDRQLDDDIWEVDADPTRSVVILRSNQRTKDNFQKFRRKKLAMQTLYLSAMVQVLNTALKYEEFNTDEIDPSRWIGVIGGKLKKNGVSIREDENLERYFTLDGNDDLVSPLWVAQRLLENPLKELHEENNTEQQE